MPYLIKLFSLFLLISTLLSADELKYATDTIPKHDLREIKSLFKILFDKQGFSYSLYGDKALSFSDFSLYNYSSNELLNFLPLDKCCESLLEIFCEPTGFLKERWEIWQKYKHLFKIEKYVLVKKNFRDQIRIFFINKKYLAKILDENIELFQAILNQKISSEDLFKEIILEETDILQSLHNNEGLLGILLGFGKHNALLFQKREKLLKELKMHLKDPLLIQKKVERINERLKILHKHDPYIIASVNRVGFLADPNHPETIQLRNNYDELNKKINEIYSKEDWFEQTLLKLTSD